MKKIYTFLIFSLLFSTPIFSVFDLSPWMIIENKTQFNFICKIEAMYYQSDSDDEQISLYINNLYESNKENFNIVFDNDLDEDDNEFLKITITFVSYAQKTLIFNPIFSQNEQLFNPEVTGISFTHQSLQITNFYTPTYTNQRYFLIEYQDGSGIITTAHEISIYIKCLNNFKQIIRNLLAAAMNATNLLPY